MTEQKHTDGPWVFEDYSQEEPEFFVVPATYYGTVAKVYREDDARLIAAAPELLEALREAEEYFYNLADADHDETGFVPNKEMKLLTVVRAAIAKATRQ